MIKAIIFDCFGVLTTDGWLPFKRKYFGHDTELFEEAGRINVLADSGKISNSQFVKQVAELAKISFDSAKYEMRNNVTNTELVEYIESKLAPNYAIGMLSNASGNFLDKLFTIEQLNLFKAVSLSCDTGYVKPDEGAYKSIVSALGLNFEDCIFIDDQPRYIEGAMQIGLRSILYQDFEQMKTELETILEMSDTDK